MQGASRGLGLEFVKQLLDKQDQRYVPHVLMHDTPVAS